MPPDLFQHRPSLPNAPPPPLPDPDVTTCTINSFRACDMTNRVTPNWSQQLELFWRGVRKQVSLWFGSADRARLALLSPVSTTSQSVYHAACHPFLFAGRKGMTAAINSDSRSFIGAPVMRATDGRGRSHDNLEGHAIVGSIPHAKNRRRGGCWERTQGSRHSKDGQLPSLSLIMDTSFYRRRSRKVNMSPAVEKEHSSKF